MHSDENKYKMLVADMDNTLLNKEKKVSERNRSALSKAMEKGVKIVIATGRVYTSARVYARLLGLNTPIIASNGAVIREADFKSPGHTEKVIYKKLLPPEAVIEMLRLSKKYDIFCHFFTEDTIYADKLVNISLRYTNWNKYLGEEDKVKVIIADDLEKEIQESKPEILKASIVDSDNDKINSIRREILKTGIVSVSQSMKNNIEVMDKDVSKGSAVRILSEMLQIKREEIIAIGDNENDISMIEYAGLGIAMGNAEESLKNAADYITGDYEEDGVAQAIEKFIL